MAPLQVLIVPVNVEKFGAYGEKLLAVLNDRLFRAEIDMGPDSLNKKIRNAATNKIPNILVVGGNEEETNSVTWRRHGHQEQRSLPFEAFLAILEKMRTERIMDNFTDTELPQA